MYFFWIDFLCRKCGRAHIDFSRYNSTVGMSLHGLMSNIARAEAKQG